MPLANAVYEHVAGGRSVASAFGAISLHTDDPPTGGNELDPSFHGGYARVAAGGFIVSHNPTRVLQALPARAFPEATSSWWNVRVAAYCTAAVRGADDQVAWARLASPLNVMRGVRARIETGMGVVLRASDVVRDPRALAAPEALSPHAPSARDSWETYLRQGSREVRFPLLYLGLHTAAPDTTSNHEIAPPGQRGYARVPFGAVFTTAGTAQGTYGRRFRMASSLATNTGARFGPFTGQGQIGTPSHWALWTANGVPGQGISFLLMVGRLKAPVPVAPSSGWYYFQDAQDLDFDFTPPALRASS